MVTRTLAHAVSRVGCDTNKGASWVVFEEVMVSPLDRQHIKSD